MEAEGIFTEIQRQLDAKHDKHEQLVKLSRDCTIQSKRIIFQLHRAWGDKPGGPSVLREAEEKLKKVHNNLKEIAAKLGGGENTHKFHRAFSPGLQEYVEALSYLSYLKSAKLISLREAQRSIEWSDSVILELNPNDFVLGIADLSGELMRRCTNAVTEGNRSQPFELLGFMRALYCGVLSLPPSASCRELSRKLPVLQSNVLKVERICYTLKIRGSELPASMLALDE